MSTGLYHPHLTAKTSPFPNPNITPSKRFSPRARAIATAAPNQSYWTSIDADIQAYLEKAIPLRSPESVFEPMRHLTFAAPRTTASALCVAACELVGGDRSLAMAAAAAVHLIHAAAYAHENLPLTDRSSPKPGIPHKFSPNIELLTGDGIVPFGLELVARSMDLEKKNSDKVLRAIVEISKAGGSQGVVDGQYLELETDHDVEIVCGKKEGTMHACGAVCGAVLGGGAEEEIERLRRFGVYAGTVRGLRSIPAKGDGEKLRGTIEKLQGLALGELESFNGNKIAMVIAGLVE